MSVVLILDPGDDHDGLLLTSPEARGLGSLGEISGLPQGVETAGRSPFQA